MLSKYKTIRIGDIQIEFIPFFITLFGIITMCSLGFWQLCRLKEKTAFIQSISENLRNSPLNYTAEPSPTIYQKIKMKGHFLINKDIYLYGRRASAPDREGYYLLSPFQTTDGNIKMVARGWFAAKNKPFIVTDYNNMQEEIIGIVLPFENVRMFIPDNDLKNNVWFTLGHKQIMNYIGQQLENFYLLQIAPQNLPAQVIPIDANNLIRVKNDHLEYALTWFSLAICLGVIFIIYNK